MRKIILSFIFLLAIIAILPIPLYAAAKVTCPAASSGIPAFLCNIQEILNSIVPILILLGVIYFIWGVIMYMIADSEEAKTKGKDQIIYGLIGFAVIVGLWGLVNIVVDFFGFSATDLGAPSLQAISVSAGSSDSCAIGKDFQGLANFVTCVINNSIIPLIFAFAIVMFIWGAVKFFIINADEEAQREQGKQFMIWGIIALTVMMTVWGLVGILGSTFGFNSKFLPRVCPPGPDQCK